MQIKRTLTFFDEIGMEAGQKIDPPLRKVAVVADHRQSVCRTLRARSEPADESERRDRTNKSAGSRCRCCRRYKPESYGKAAIIGINGEQEHGVALLTTVFGNVMRDAAGGGKAWISSLTKRAAPGSTIDIPLAHKDALYVRSHYDGITITIPDAPLPNEIAVICAYANRGRPNHRVGGLAAGEIKGIDGLT